MAASSGKSKSISNGPRGRVLTLPPERGRSPPAARRSVEVFWSLPETLHRPYCCGPGRSYVFSVAQNCIGPRSVGGDFKMRPAGDCAEIDARVQRNRAKQLKITNPQPDVADIRETA